MRKLLSLISFAVLVSLAFASPVAAATVVSNLGEPQVDSLRILSQGVGLEVFGASSFTVDGSDYVLNSVTLALQFQEIDPQDGGFFVEIRDDASGNPGALVTNGALTGPSNPITICDPPAPFCVHTATYTAIGLTLSAKTTYWVVAGVSVGGGWYRWNMTTSDDEAGTWTIGDQSGRISSDQGASWSQLSTESGPAVSQFSIDASDCPCFDAAALSQPPLFGTCRAYSAWAAGYTQYLGWPFFSGETWMNGCWYTSPYVPDVIRSVITPEEYNACRQTALDAAANAGVSCFVQ